MRPAAGSELLWWLVASGAAYVLLLLAGWALGGRYYTVDWLTPRLWVLAVVTLLATLARVRATLWSLAGVVLGAVTGEVIGEAVFRRQVQRLATEHAAAGPDFVQEWEPSHPGWWIALVVFAVMTLLGLLVGRPGGVRSDTGTGHESSAGAGHLAV
jgi:xanthine/uracil permease